MGKRINRTFEERCAQVYKYIVWYIRKYGIAPSYRDIKKTTGLKGDGHIRVIIDHLIAKGKLKRQAGVARGLRLPDIAPEAMYSVSMLGHIAANNEQPLVVYEELDPDSVRDVPLDLLPNGVNPDELFALRVVGDSMSAALIGDGDIVILRRGDLWNDGDIVAIWLKNEDATTLKKLYHSEYDVVKLKPKSKRPGHFNRSENEQDIKVMGRLVAVMRKC